MNTTTKSENAGAATHAARLRRYVTTAAAGVTAAAGSADAAVVRSSDQAGWTTQTVSRTGITIGDDFVTNFHDARLNKAFKAFAAVNRWRTTNYGNEWIRGGVFRNNNESGYTGRVFNGRLASGDVIGASRLFTAELVLGGSFNKSGDQWAPMDTIPNSIATLPTGAWSLGTANVADSVRGYLGFRFNDGSSDFYGYFDVELSRDGVGRTSSTFSMIVHGWAYGDQGEAITIGPPSAVPGGAGLAALAVGAVGLRGRRRSKVA